MSAESFEKRLLEAREVFVPQHKIDPSNAKKKPMWMTADARTNINPLTAVSRDPDENFL